MGFLILLEPFQPTLPHRERRFCEQLQAGLLLISTHAPAQGATHAPSVLMYGNAAISTHAPAQGATDVISRFIHIVLTISTHAPAQGATLASPCVSAPLVYFNPRSRTGSDETDVIGDSRRNHFNPRSRTGSDG